MIKQKYGHTRRDERDQYLWQQAWRMLGLLISDGFLDLPNLDQLGDNRAAALSELNTLVCQCVDVIDNLCFYQLRELDSSPYGQADEPDEHGYYHDLTPDRYDELTPSSLIELGFKIIPPEKPKKKGKKRKGKSAK